MRPALALSVLLLPACGGDPCAGAPGGDPATATVEISRDLADFESLLGDFACLHWVSFDDVDASGEEPVAIAADRYQALGIRILGAEGQYVHPDFGLPADYGFPPSAPNLYAPGPMPGESMDYPYGGNETTVRFFDAEGGRAPVAAFSAVWVDADEASAGSGMIAYDASGAELAARTGLDGPSGEALFVGMVALDADGVPAPAIHELLLVNGAEWVGRDETEGAALDDFRFTPPG